MTVRNESPTATPPPQSPPQPVSPPDPDEPTDIAQIQAHQEHLRNFLRAPQPGDDRQQNEHEDPMIKMMNQLMGGMQGNGADSNQLPISPGDLSKATGLPTFVSDMLLGKQGAPPTEAQLKLAKIWKMVHTIFAIVASIYTIFILDRSVSLFGKQPPAPATVRNPFLVFIMGELVIQGSKAVNLGSTGKQGLGLALQILKDFGADGCLVIFTMGVWSWWQGLVTT